MLEKAPPIEPLVLLFAPEAPVPPLELLTAIVLAGELAEELPPEVPSELGALFLELLAWAQSRHSSRASCP